MLKKRFVVEESKEFLKNIEDVVEWILISNIDHSELLADKKIEEFKKDIEELRLKISSFPEIGKDDQDLGIRKFPIYQGRYSVQWIVLERQRRVILLSLVDSKYSGGLKEFKFDND